MLGDIDRNRKTAYEELELILCKPDGEEICVLEEAYNIEIVIDLDEVDELHFDIPYYVEQQYQQTENINWDRIKGDYLVKVNDEQCFVIKQIIDSGIEKDVKSVVCYSREYQLGERKLRLFKGTRQLYLDDIDGAGVSIRYSFDGVNWFNYKDPFVVERGKVLYVETYNLKEQIVSSFEWSSNQSPEPETPGVAITTLDLDNDKVIIGMRLIAETGVGLLNMLEAETAWTVGYIDPDVREDKSLGQEHRKYRTFDIVDKPWLAVLKEDVQNAFECLIFFDTIEQVINIYHVDNVGENKGLFISNENYAKTIQRATTHDEIITRLYVYGKDNLGIAEVNPTGLPYIEDFSYFRNRKYMPQDLLDALDDYDALLNQNTNTFNKYLNELSELRKINVQLNNQLIDLWMEWQVAQDNIDLAIQSAVPEDLEIDLEPVDLSQLNNIRDQVQSKIDAKEIEIKTNEQQIESKLQQIADLKELLAKENNFTARQLQILDSFIYEDTWSNENYYNAVELYNNAWKVLKKKNEPIIDFEIEVVDFLNVVECQHDWDKLILGDFINVYYDKFSVDDEVRLVGLTHGIDNNTLSLRFSNQEDRQSSESQVASILNDAQLTTSMVEAFKHQWDLSLSNQDQVSKIMNSVLDTTKNRLVSGRNQNITIDERGIWLKDMEDDNEQLRMLNNVLAMTTDGWKSVSLAVTPRGIVGENIFGKVVASNKLLITNINDSGESTFKVDKNHMEAFNMDLSIENATNRIFLNPAQGLRIQQRKGTSWEDKLYLDSSGDIFAQSFNVINTKSRLDDTGLKIFGGAISVYKGSSTREEDRVFWATPSGEVYARNFHAIGNPALPEDAGLQIRDGVITINNFYSEKVLYADSVGNLTLDGKLRITQNSKVLLEAFKHTATNPRGGTLRINDIDGNNKIYMSGTRDSNKSSYISLRNMRGDITYQMYIDSNNVLNVRSDGAPILLRVNSNNYIRISSSGVKIKGTRIDLNE